MSQLAYAEESPAEVVVAKCSSLVTLLGLADSDFELVLSSGICDDFPVMNAFVECDIAEECPKEVVVLLEVDASLVGRHAEYVDVARVDLPDEARDQHAHNLSL
mmetsp:Transcript_21642/g.28989  ORF Transcript_21642/g.28989 Transcript_21642/m.28989 type:complete len:104 (-) Transcript_21642:954-1265(-)